MSFENDIVPDPNVTVLSNWRHLYNPYCWLEAAAQIFYSLSLGKHKDMFYIEHIYTYHPVHIMFRVWS